MKSKTAILVTCILLLAPLDTATAQTQVLGWGNNSSGKLNVPALPPGLTYTQVAAGYVSSAAVRSDGSIVAWGTGLTNVPALPPGLAYTQVAVGGWESTWCIPCFGGMSCWPTPTCSSYPISHAVALRNDGSAVAWGDNSYGQTNVPALPPGLTYLQVEAGGWHGVALRSDLSVVSWGDNSFGQANVPIPPPGLAYVQVAAGRFSSAALRTDGAIVTSGTFPAVWSPPPGLTFTQVAMGFDQTVALRSDGAITSSSTQSQVPALPPGLIYTQVAAGGDSGGYQFRHTVALRSDGSVVIWGDNNNGGYTTVLPPLPPGGICTQVADGASHTLALVSAVSAVPVSTIGVGCPGSNGVTTLWTPQIPSLGNAGFSLHVTGGAFNSQALLFLAMSPASPSISLGGGCMIHLDLPSLHAFVAAGVSPMGPLPTDAAGLTSFALPIPADPALAGLPLCFQAAVVDPPATLGFTVSNGIQCTLQ